MSRNKDYTLWVEAALDVIGGKWKPPIVLALRDGTQRYSGISRKLPGISERMLVKQVRELERDGIITRTVYAKSSPEGRVCPYGVRQKLVPVLRRLSLWSATWLGHDIVGDGPPAGAWDDPARLRLLLGDIYALRDEMDKMLKNR